MRQNHVAALVKAGMFTNQSPPCTPVPTLDVLRALARALACTIDYLTFDDDERGAPGPFGSVVDACRLGLSDSPTEDGEGVVVTLCEP